MVSLFVFNKRSGGIFTRTGYRHRRCGRPGSPFCPADCRGRTGTCSVEAIRLSRELEGKGQAEADIVVAIVGLVPVAIRSAAVDSVVEVVAAAEHAHGLSAVTILLFSNPI